MNQWQRKLFTKDTLFALSIGILLVSLYQLRHYLISNNSDTIKAYVQQDVVAKELKKGRGFISARNYDAAIACYKNILRHNANNVDAHCELGIALAQKGQPNAAIKQLEHAIHVDSNFAQSYIYLGHIYAKQGNFALAEENYALALQKKPEHSIAHMGIAELAHKKKDFATIVTHLEPVIKQEADNKPALWLLGDAYSRLGKAEHALKIYETLTTLEPQSYASWKNLGLAYQHQNKFDQAITYYKKAVALDPNNYNTHIALSGAYFALGDLPHGYQEYEWRLHTSNLKNIQGLWDGSDVKGKTILVLSENGIGDIFQYIRFAKSLKERGAHIIVSAKKSLVNLLKQCDYINQVAIAGERIARYDAVVSMQSIPRYINTTLNTLPATPYIFGKPELIKKWAEKLASDKHFKIGLCWCSGCDSHHVPQGVRSIPLAQLAPLAQIKNIHFYSLQMGDGENQLKDLPEGFYVKEFGQDFDTHHGAFMDTAAVMKNLDLIISIDTSVAHLAGSLGVPTWILLPYHPDVRWMVDRSDTPWYPNAKLFRQPKPGDWESVITRVAGELKARVRA